MTTSSFVFSSAVPLDPRLPLDPSELNLFACKLDRIRSLRDEDFLVDQVLEWTPNSDAISNGLSVLQQQTFGPMFGQLLENANQIDSDYAKALAAVAVWRTNVLPARTRCGALFFRASNLGGIMQPSTYHCPLFHIRTASLGRWVARRIV